MHAGWSVYYRYTHTHSQTCTSRDLRGIYLLRSTCWDFPHLRLISSFYWSLKCTRRILSLYTCIWPLIFQPIFDLELFYTALSVGITCMYVCMYVCMYALACGCYVVMFGACINKIPRTKDLIVEHSCTHSIHVWLYNTWLYSNTF